MQEKIVKNEKNVAKNALTIALYTILSIACAVLVLSACVVSKAAFGRNAENTLQLFGYKVFLCQNDIQDTDIKSGSLVIVKDTDYDDFYTPQSLSENVALIIPSGAEFLKNDFVWITLALCTPIALLCIGLLLSELKGLSMHRDEIKMQQSIEQFEEI